MSQQVLPLHIIRELPYGRWDREALLSVIGNIQAYGKNTIRVFLFMPETTTDEIRVGELIALLSSMAGSLNLSIRLNYYTEDGNEPKEERFNYDLFGYAGRQRLSITAFTYEATGRYYDPLGAAIGILHDMGLNIQYGAEPENPYDLVALHHAGHHITRRPVHGTEGNRSQEPTPEHGFDTVRIHYMIGGTPTFIDNPLHGVAE